MPNDVLFTDQNGNYVTKNTIRSSKTIEQMYEEELELIKNGDTILDNVKD